MNNSRQYPAEITIWNNGKIMIDPKEEEKEIHLYIVQKVSKKTKKSRK
jgi:hypothetical protein